MTRALCDRCSAELAHGVDLPIAMRGPIWEIDGERRHAPPILRRIFRILWSRRGTFVSRDSLMTLLYGMSSDPPADHTIAVHVFRLRALLAGADFHIVNSYGQGWCLEPGALKNAPIHLHSGQAHRSPRHRKPQLTAQQLLHQWKDQWMKISSAGVSAIALILLSASPVIAKGVAIPCGGNIQSYVDSKPSGTVFRLAGCAYSGQKLNLSGKDGDTFLGAGRNATILDGAGQQGPLLNAGLGNYGGTQTSNITFAHLTIQNYAQGMATNPDPQANNTCAAFGSAQLYAWAGWALKDVKISGSQCVGVDLGHDATLENSLITGNGMTGINANNDTGLPGTITVIGNEISYNNTRGIGLDWDSGGMKAAYSAANLSILNNYIHDNDGVGFWCDVSCSPNLTVQGNTIVNNSRAGIMMEITAIGAADISRNVANRNYIGVFVSSSSGADVHDNNVYVGSSDSFGILVQADPGRIDTVANDTVHNNVVTLTGASGSQVEGFRNYAGAGVSNVWSNGNSFYVRNTSGAYFAWGSNTTPLSWSAYRNLTGQDAGSTISAGSALASGCRRIGCAGSGL